MSMLKVKELKLGDIFHECEYGINAKYIVVEAPVYYPVDARNVRNYADGWGCVGKYLGNTILKMVDGKLTESLRVEGEHVATVGENTNFFCSDEYAEYLRLYEDAQYIGG